ncbi:MAG: GntR family transcriptional regulator [Ruminococcaceae bacterium]|nr:GntR family transcriptional regulator [Oscillospiraceae bacterium]
MFSVNAMSGVPVYEQLVNQVETYIAMGILEAGSQLPSVRSLSVALSVNPNTVQKAFSDLIQRGIVTAVPGKGNFVSEDALSAIREKGKKRLAGLSSLVRELRLFGIEKEELIKVIEKEYSFEGGDDK